MKVITAKSAGFCFGVNRAVEMVRELAQKGERVYTLGPIIHNDFVVKELEALGVAAIGSPEENTDDRLVVIRSHGVPAEIYRRLEQMGRFSSAGIWCSAPAALTFALTPAVQSSSALWLASILEGSPVISIHIPSVV